MLYHLIFICSIWNQDKEERERDFESLQNTQSYPRPAKKWITECGGIGVGQAPTATPFRLPRQCTSTQYEYLIRLSKGNSKNNNLIKSNLIPSLQTSKCSMKLHLKTLQNWRYIIILSSCEKKFDVDIKLEIYTFGMQQLQRVWCYKSTVQVTSPQK